MRITVISHPTLGELDKEAFRSMVRQQVKEQIQVTVVQRAKDDDRLLGWPAGCVTVIDGGAGD